MLMDAKGRELPMSATYGAFPKMLRRLARTAKQPYKTALKMAAEEIEELREQVGYIKNQAQAAISSGHDRDFKIATQR